MKLMHSVVWNSKTSKTQICFAKLCLLLYVKHLENITLFFKLLTKWTKKKLLSIGFNFGDETQEKLILLFLLIFFILVLSSFQPVSIDKTIHADPGPTSCFYSAHRFFEQFTCYLWAKERFAHETEWIAPAALLSLATRANHSWSLFCKEQWQQIAQIAL